MSDFNIDDAVMAAAKPTWRKVAMVIVTAAHALGENLPAGNKGQRIVAKHIETLVQASRLVAQGNIRKWRHGEVRLPGKTLVPCPQTALSCKSPRPK